MSEPMALPGAGLRGPFKFLARMLLAWTIALAQVGFMTFWWRPSVDEEDFGRTCPDSYLAITLGSAIVLSALSSAIEIVWEKRPEKTRKHSQFRAWFLRSPSAWGIAVQSTILTGLFITWAWMDAQGMDAVTGPLWMWLCFLSVPSVPVVFACGLLVREVLFTAEAVGVRFRRSTRC